VCNEHSLQHWCWGPATRHLQIPSILRRRPIVVPLLLPALLEGLHLPFASLVLCLWFGTKATSATRSAQDIPRPCKPASPSSRRSNRSAWCSPLHWSLISLSSQKDHRTAFPPAQPVLKILVSLIPVSIEVVPEFGHWRTTHQARRHHQRSHQACDRSLR
jgi:hypothetical protein